MQGPRLAWAGEQGWAGAPVRTAPEDEEKQAGAGGLYSSPLPGLPPPPSCWFSQTVHRNRGSGVCPCHITVSCYGLEDTGNKR